MRLIIALLAIPALMLPACAHYSVPGRAADLSSLALHPTPPDPRDAQTPGDIRAELNKQALVKFPAAIAVARVQESGYRSSSCDSYGSGRFSVLTGRDVETDSDFERLAKLPLVKGVAPVNRLLLSRDLRRDEDLRRAAASLHADLLLLYTFDTTFWTDDAAPPLGLVTLGLFPTKGVKVRSTASAILLDTRNGYTYAVAEGTAKSGQIANGWTSEAAAETARKRAEREALDGLLTSIESAWKGVIDQYAVAPAVTTASPSAASR